MNSFEKPVATVERELTIFDYLPKVLPVLDLLCIVWVAVNSPAVWITTAINISLPLIGFLSLIIFKDKGRPGFYLIGFFSSIPLFFLNCWGSVETPTWLAEFSFIAGGLLLTTTFTDRLVVIGFVFCTTIVPLLINHNTIYFITTVVLAQLGVWFLLERSMKFMDMQKAQIEKQKLLVEEKQKEVMDSLHYAKRIQKSLLPNDKYIDANLKRLKK